MITLHRTRSGDVTAKRPKSDPWKVTFSDGVTVEIAEAAFDLLFERVERRKYRLRRGLVYAEPFGRDWRVYCPEDDVLDVPKFPFGVLFLPADEKHLRSLLSQAEWSAAKPWGDRYDWELGREMWSVGKRAQDIARTLGCSEEAVKRRAREDGWKRKEKPIDRRTEDRATQRKANRRILEDPAACPTCWQVTLRDPCAHCHYQLPPNGRRAETE